MSNTKYWLWLQQSFGYASKIKSVTDNFKTAEEFYAAGEIAWKECGIDPKKINFLKSTNLDTFDETIEFCKKHSIRILTPEDEYYPRKLLEFENFPAVLFARGDYTCLNSHLPIAVLGSRKPSAYGEKAVNFVVPTLCENEAVIVSGGALGIDSLAHKSAMDNEGKTILVLGYGHGAEYLPENRGLRKRIAKNGVIISEYLPYVKPKSWCFSQRNRIITGMSEAVVIIEAAAGSNTINIANKAKKQGRKVFVLPGDISSGRFEGSNQLIRSGATAFFSGEDIINSIKGTTYSITHKKINSDIMFAEIDRTASSAKAIKKKIKNNAKIKDNDTAKGEFLNISEKIFLKVFLKTLR